MINSISKTLSLKSQWDILVDGLSKSGNPSLEPERNRRVRFEKIHTEVMLKKCDKWMRERKGEKAKKRTRGNSLQGKGTWEGVGKVRNRTKLHWNQESNFRKKRVVPKASCCRVVWKDKAIDFGNQEVISESRFCKGWRERPSLKQFWNQYKTYRESEQESWSKWGKLE